MTMYTCDIFVVSGLAQYSCSQKSAKSVSRLAVVSEHMFSAWLCVSTLIHIRRVYMQDAPNMERPNWVFMRTTRGTCRSKHVLARANWHQLNLQ